MEMRQEFLHRNIADDYERGMEIEKHIEQRRAELIRELGLRSPERMRQEQEYMFGPTPRRHPPKSAAIAKQRKANKAARKARKK